MDLVFPHKKFRIKNVLREWAVSVEARSLRTKRDSAHKYAIRINSSKAWADYREIRNKHLRKAKFNFYNQVIAELKAKPQKFWHH